MASDHSLNRREFLATATAASAFTVLPRHVLGGTGYVAPSDKLNMALIGTGTMGLNMLMSDWLPREDLHITCVCDPNKDSQDYRDWSATGIRDRTRRFLNDPEWGAKNKGIRAGREVGRKLVEAYYGKVRGTEDYQGCGAYEDFRELLEKEDDLDGVLVMTPEHLHATIGIAAMKKGKHVISHKTLSNVLYEVRLAADTARETGKVTHLMAWQHDQQYLTLKAWLDSGIIGPVQEVHNWTNRPVWPQGWLDWLPEQKKPKGLNWDLWLGPVPHRPYNLNYTHALFRGWFDFGSGCLGDMGNYSLWRIYQMLDLDPPTRIEGVSSIACAVQNGVSRPKPSQVAFPNASTIRWWHPAKGDRPAVEVFWYDGNIKPQTPPELYEDDAMLPREGMLIVGKYGKLLCDFLGGNPRLLPAKRHEALANVIQVDESAAITGLDDWIDAIKAGQSESRGSFQNVQNLAEATCLGNIATRLNTRLEWDAEAMRFTNNEAANTLLRREYRKGWEL